jgi:hypothetical protein
MCMYCTFGSILAFGVGNFLQIFLPKQKVLILALTLVHGEEVPDTSLVVLDLNPLTTHTYIFMNKIFKNAP